MQNLFKIFLNPLVHFTRSRQFGSRHESISQYSRDRIFPHSTSTPPKSKPLNLSLTFRLLKTFHSTKFSQQTHINPHTTRSLLLLYIMHLLLHSSLTLVYYSLLITLFSDFMRYFSHFSLKLNLNISLLLDTSSNLQQYQFQSNILYTLTVEHDIFLDPFSILLL